LEFPSNVRLSDALRMLQHVGVTAEAVRGVAVGDDAPLLLRYLLMVDGAGIVMWLMGQVRSLFSLGSQTDVVNFLEECDGQPWFGWVEPTGAQAHSSTSWGVHHPE
ncbi:unnamed protein product, partial [Closterium sp. Naga37s-1]